MKQEKAETKPLPGGENAREALYRLIGKILLLPNVSSLSLSKQGVTLTRVVGEEEVWPENLYGEDDIDLVGYEFLLKRLQLVELPPAKCTFPPEALQEAAALLGNQLIGFLAPAGELAAAYFGIEGVPTHILGYPVIYGDDQTTKLVVVGSPSHYWSDAREGVVIEMAVGL